MVRKNGTYEVRHNEAMRGGDGTVVMETLLTPEELYNKGRLFAKLTP